MFSSSVAAEKGTSIAENGHFNASLLMPVLQPLETRSLRLVGPRLTADVLTTELYVAVEVLSVTLVGGQILRRAKKGGFHAARSIRHYGLKPDLRRCGTQILTLHASARPTGWPVPAQSGPMSCDPPAEGEHAGRAENGSSRVAGNIHSLRFAPKFPIQTILTCELDIFVR